MTNKSAQNFKKLLYIDNNRLVYNKKKSLIFFHEIADPCVYNNLEFKGGDLSVIPSLGFEACKSACQKFKGCSFFTVTSLACILKDSNVEIHRKSGVLSGATDQTCGKLCTCLSKYWIVDLNNEKYCKQYHFKN